MSTHIELEQAIAALKDQRALLGDDVIDLALATLREKLDSIQASLVLLKEHAQMSVLVADMSGFTAMSEFMDAEDVRDTINAVWQKLDSVIVSWGGRVDKHVGDGVIALFGMPTVQEDDPERAVQAALDMQMELALFNERTLRLDSGQLHSQRRLQMRIGIHQGSVFFGQVGTQDEYTAVGDAITTANQLEKLAPVGGILVSNDIYERIHPYFDLEALDPVVLNGRDKPTHVYVVKREKPHAFRRASGGTSFLESRILGRANELTQLQESLQATIEEQVAQVITIVGEPGVGKSRLLYEFERLLALSPERVALFRGGANKSIVQTPYGLIRDLFSNYFDIHRRNSPSVAREKLVRGVMNVLKGNPTEAQGKAHFIGHLLGFDFLDSPFLQESLDDPRQVRTYAFQDLVQFFTAVTQENAAAVLLLEDIHWADEASFDLLDYLVQTCHDLPLLFVCVARPSLFEKRPSWQLVEALVQATYQQIELQPLSLIDSRHFVTEMLQNVASMPARFADVLVNGAGGNPLHLAELVNILIQEEVIDAGGPQWHVKMGHLLDLPAPLTIENLTQFRLGQLTDIEQETLQLASVIGIFFWDSCLAQLSLNGRTIKDDDLTAVLDQLIQTEWLYRGKHSTFPGLQEYAFRHDSVRDVVYDSMSPEARQQIHAQVAAWLDSLFDQQSASLARVIAYHLEQAGETEQAVIWYGHAARQAQTNDAPETAVYYYRQALSLLPDSLDTIEQRMLLNEGLGETLRWQARFKEAVAAFQAMQAAAEKTSDQLAQVHAYQWLFLTHYCQGELVTALACAQNAVSLAREAQSDAHVVTSLTCQGRVSLLLGDLKSAVSIGQEAHVLSQAFEAPLARAFSQALVGLIGCETFHYDRATQATETARNLFRELNDQMWEGLMLAQLGQIAWQQYEVETAIDHYELALRFANDVGDYYGSMLALQNLGQIAHYQSNYLQAKEYFQRAMILAERSDNDVYRAHLANELGLLHLSQAIYEPQSAMDIVRKEDDLMQAYTWLEQAVRLARQEDQPLVVSTAVAGLALLFLEDHLLDEARAQAQEAVELSQQVVAQYPGRLAKKVTAVSWRTLGVVLAKLPQKNMKATVSGKTEDATSCFTRSQQLWDELGAPELFEKAQTLSVWATYEHLRGEDLQADAFSREAMAIYSRLGLSQKVRQTSEIVA